jgi:hypothetical protein
MRPVALVLAACCAFGSLAPARAHEGHDPKTPEPATATRSDRDGRWRENLKFVVETIRRDHPKPFFRGTEARFDSLVTAIHAEIPRRTDEQNVVELMRLVAALGDGHTALIAAETTPGFERWVPLRVYLEADGGAYVQAALEPQARALGARIVRIGGLAVEDVVARARAVAGGDNDFSRLDRTPFTLLRAGALRALGVATLNDQVRFDVVDAQGKRSALEVPLVPGGGRSPFAILAAEGLPFEGARLARDAAGAATPLHRRDPERAWWYERLADGTLYFQMRRVDPTDRGETFGAFVERMFAFADSAKVERMVIDLRHNHGGNNMILRPLIHGLIRRPQLDRRGRLFTVIGRGTFSAAMNAVNLLEEHTNTLFVGEPTGASPNHYGDASHYRLPHHGLALFVSRWPWAARLPWDARPWVAPHLPAPPTFAAELAGRDPALEAIAAYRDVALDERLRARALAGDAAGARAAVAAYHARFPDRWGRTVERPVNDLAYGLMAEGRRDAALVLFELNAATYPRSANAWDGLAEAHAEAGDTAKAKELYRKALALDPESRSAREGLERLEGSHGSGDGHGH